MRHRRCLRVHVQILFSNTWRVHDRLLCCTYSYTMTCIAACTIATWRYRYSSLYRSVTGLSWTDMKRDVTYRPLLELLVEHSLKDTPYDRQSLSVVSSTNTNTSCTLRYQGKIVKKYPIRNSQYRWRLFAGFARSASSILAQLLSRLWQLYGRHGYLNTIRSPDARG